MIIEIEEINLPELAPFVSLADGRLRKEELLIAESPKVIKRALDAGLEPVSLLCESKHIVGDAKEIVDKYPNIPVYTGERELLSSLTGYTLTRGVLCAMRRPEQPSPEGMLKDARRVCVIYDICDTTNIGSIFRSAAALGYDAVVLSSESCDPFNRRSIRVSMGTVFQIPWCFVSDVVGVLKRNSFRTVSTALTDNSVFLQDFTVSNDEKYAIILGSEGHGLPESVIDSTDVVVKIPMFHGVDSLNVGAAAAIILWHFR